MKYIYKYSMEGKGRTFSPTIEKKKYVVREDIESKVELPSVVIEVSKVKYGKVIKTNYTVLSKNIGIPSDLNRKILWLPEENDEQALGYFSSVLEYKMRALEKELDEISERMEFIREVKSQIAISKSVDKKADAIGRYTKEGYQILYIGESGFLAKRDGEPETFVEFK